MDKIKKIYYVYYSFEESGRGYIGYRKCPEGETPETDKYLGSATDKTFKPIGKTILKRNLTQREAIAVEIYFQRKYKVAEKWNKDFANLSYQTSEGFYYSASGENNPFFGQTHSEETKQKISEAMKGENNPGYGKTRYNNGIKERLIFPGEEIPEGYFTGRLPNSEETIQKISEAMKGENSPNYGKVCYNNGIEQRYFPPDEEIPEGFVLGRKEEIKQKISEAMKGENNPSYGKKWYNNGIKDILISPDEEIPEGYFLGVKVETKQKCSEAMKSINSKHKIRVITSTSCYFSVKDACEELGKSKKWFYKRFKKDLDTGFYVEK